MARGTRTPKKVVLAFEEVQPTARGGGQIKGKGGAQLWVWPSPVCALGAGEARSDLCVLSPMTTCVLMPIKSLLKEISCYPISSSFCISITAHLEDYSSDIKGAGENPVTCGWKPLLLRGKGCGGWTLDPHPSGPHKKGEKCVKPLSGQLAHLSHSTNSAPSPEGADNCSKEGLAGRVITVLCVPHPLTSANVRNKPKCKATLPRILPQGCTGFQLGPNF